MPSSKTIFLKAKNLLSGLGFRVVQEDNSRPWGGFLVIDEEQAPEFASLFFPEEQLETLKISDKLSPKILLIAPGKRLSWQYHFRRAEIWKCIDGAAGVITSDTDEEKHQVILRKGDKVKLKQGERHRLIGLKSWGVIAEIWQHTDANHPSDEEDIVRLQDDFGR
jgi:mannose-6-phosphate isomerase-like protein (cupin superfamily)